MKLSTLSLSAMVGLGLAMSATARAGGELQSRSETEQTVTQTQTAPQAPLTYGGGQSYRFCLAYPYNGPRQYPCYPPNGMTHYAPGYVYPGYAYAGYGAAGMGPGPVLTGGIIGLTAAAILF